jgi:hypothetical protein
MLKELMSTQERGFTLKQRSIKDKDDRALNTKLNSNSLSSTNQYLSTLESVREENTFSSNKLNPDLLTNTRRPKQQPKIKLTMSTDQDMIQSPYRIISP